MEYKVEDMKADVRTAIDENRRSESLVLDGDTDTLSLEDVIGQKLEDAVKTVEMSAPARLLDGVSFAECDTTVNRDFSGSVALPGDFMRLVAFKMSDWERGVYNAIDPSDAEYMYQKSRWGIGGNWERPVCAVVPDANGLKLEFYRSKSKDTKVETALYRPYPAVKDGKIDVSKRLYKAAVYMAAALTLMTYSDEAAAKMMTEQSNNAIK